MPYIGKTTDGFGVRNRFVYLASSGDTSVSGADANGATLTFTDGAYVDVYLNGVLLKPTTDYNTSTANTIAGLSALNTNDEVTVVVYDIFTVADMVSATSGGTFSGNVNFSNNIDVDGTANLDVVDIDGAVDMASSLTVGGAFTSVGIDDNADATAITIDSAENVGIGQAPETGHHANWTAVDFGNRGGIAQYKTTGDVSLSYNLYHDGAWKAKENDASARYAIGNGPHHIWYTGASASADASVTLTEAMRINSSSIVTKAVNPHFIGGVQSTVGSTSGYNEGTGQSMIANVEQDDTGGHYNNTNGDFTCPVTGVYQVNFHGFLHTNQSTGNYSIQIKLNASIMQIAYFAHVNGNNTYMSYSTAIRAAATNILTIKLMNGLWYAADWRYFGKSIYLLG